MTCLQEGKLYAVSFGFLKLEGIKVNAVTYERLNTQPGPLPACKLYEVCCCQCSMLMQATEWLLATRSLTAALTDNIQVVYI